MKLLVTGGTGNVGAEVVKALQKRNADIRLLVRKEGASTPKRFEVASGDLLDPVSVQNALEGVDKLYLLNAVVPDELTQGLRGRLVFVKSPSSARRARIPFPRTKAPACSEPGYSRRSSSDGGADRASRV
jgi:uncharacterized protein YbjT (DUF2867 family)